MILAKTQRSPSKDQVYIIDLQKDLKKHHA